MRDEILSRPDYPLTAQAQVAEITKEIDGINGRVAALEELDASPG